MSTQTAMRSAMLVTWLDGAGELVREHSDRLTQLDAAIGDGDHGVNMTRGLDAVGKALAAQPDGVAPGRLLTLAGKTMVSTVGGASGPLWGSALRAAGRELGDAEDFDDGELLAALRAALAAVRDLGAAAPGDKTMVDALLPALDTLDAALQRGESLAGALAEAAEAAEAGARATIPMLARKGRASYLGERSIGHEDPGAASSTLMVRALATAAAASG